MSARATPAYLRPLGSERDRNHFALLQAARAVVAAFQVPLAAGTLRGNAACSLRLIEQAVALNERPFPAAADRPCSVPSDRFAVLPTPGESQSATFVGAAGEEAVSSPAQAGLGAADVSAAEAAPTTTEYPRAMGGGQGCTPREGPAAPLSGGAYSPKGRAATDLAPGSLRFGFASGGARL